MVWSCEIYCYAYYNTALCERHMHIICNYINIHNYNIRRGGIYIHHVHHPLSTSYTQHYRKSKVCTHSLGEYSNSLNPQQSSPPLSPWQHSRLTYTHDDWGCFLAFASSEDSHSCTCKTRGAASPFTLWFCLLASWVLDVQAAWATNIHYTCRQTCTTSAASKLTCLAFDSAIVNHDSLHGYSTLWSLTATYIHTIFVPGCGAMYTVNTSTI